MPLDVHARRRLDWERILRAVSVFTGGSLVLHFGVCVWAGDPYGFAAIPALFVPVLILGNLAVLIAAHRVVAWLRPGELHGLQIGAAVLCAAASWVRLPWLENVDLPFSLTMSIRAFVTACVATALSLGVACPIAAAVDVRRAPPTRTRLP